MGSPRAKRHWEDTLAFSQSGLKVSWVLQEEQAAPTAGAALGLVQMREMQTTSPWNQRPGQILLS